MAQAKAYTIGGIGAQPSLDDVVKIAQGTHVALDAAGAERIKKSSPAPKNFQAEAFESNANGQQSLDLLSEIHTRAVVTTKLITLMNGKSGIRLSVAEYLTALLNKGITPVLAAQKEDSGILKQLADACHASGSASVSGTVQPLASALQGADTSAPALSAAERAAMEGGASASAGISAVTVAAGKKLVTLATASAALSIEAVGAPVSGHAWSVGVADGALAGACVILCMHGGSRHQHGVMHATWQPCPGDFHLSVLRTAMNQA